VRSSKVDEFAIALEQVVARIEPQDYMNRVNFSARTCLAKASIPS
jgi:hypothetical protein